jgi:hypothetical protein
LPTEIPCEICGKHLPGIHSTSLPILAFLGFYILFHNTTAGLCPPCARWALVRGTLINLVTANLLFPIVLVMNGCTFAGTFFPKTTWETPDDPGPTRRMR